MNKPTRSTPRIAMHAVAFSRMVLVVLFSVYFCFGCADGSERGPRALHLRVLYTLEGLGDRSFADGVYRGIVSAEQSLDISRTDAVPQSVDEAEGIYDRWLREPVDDPELLITVGQLYTPFLATRSCPHDGRHYLHLDDSLPPCEDRLAVRFKVFAPSFQAGVAAMRISEHKRAAAIGGMQIPTVVEFIQGFAAGVEYAGGEMTEIVYLSEDASGFSSPQRAREEAARLFAEADVVFPVAGGSSVGVIEAAKQCASCYTLGIDSDQAYLGRGVVLGSVIKRLDLVVEDVLTDIAFGRFESGDVAYGLSEGVTRFVVNDTFREQVAQAVQGAEADAVQAEERHYEMQEARR